MIVQSTRQGHKNRKLSLGNVVESSAPAVAVEAVVRSRLRRRRELFHSKAMSHRTVSERLILDLHDRMILHELPRFYVVPVTSDSLRRYRFDIALCPHILLHHGLEVTTEATGSISRCFRERKLNDSNGSPSPLPPRSG